MSTFCYVRLTGEQLFEALSRVATEASTPTVVPGSDELLLLSRNRNSRGTRPASLDDIESQFSAPHSGN